MILVANCLKTVNDFLFMFAFTTLIAAFGGNWLLLGSVLALGFLSSLILQMEKGRIQARILCSLLPTLGICFASNDLQILVTSIVIALNAMVMLSGKYDIHYGDYIYWFGITALPALVLFLIGFFYWPIRRESTVCAGLYLFIGMLVLRIKRRGIGAGFKYGMMNFIELTGIVALGVVPSVILCAVLRIFGSVIEFILLPFGYLLHVVIAFFTRLSYVIMSDFPEKKEPVTELDQEKIQQVIDPQSKTKTLFDENLYARFDLILHIVLIALGIIALIVILYWFYRLLKNVRFASAKKTVIEVGEKEIDSIVKKLRKKKRKEISFTNNEKIREIYKDYITLLRLYGTKVASQTTSEDIMTAAGGIADFDNAEQIRALYIRARYRDSEELTDAEVSSAKELLDDFRRQIDKVTSNNM